MNAGRAGSKPLGPSSSANNLSPGNAFPSASSAEAIFSGVNPLIGCRKSAAIAAVIAFTCRAGRRNARLRAGRKRGYERSDNGRGGKYATVRRRQGAVPSRALGRDGGDGRGGVVAEGTWQAGRSDADQAATDPGRARPRRARARAMRRV